MTSIYDFGLPLVIGSFCLVGIFVLYRALVPGAFAAQLNLSKSQNKLTLWYAVVLAFAFGLLVEFVSDKVADWVPIVRSERAIRTECLFGRRNIRLKLSRHRVISSSVEDDSLKALAEGLERWMLKHPDERPIAYHPTDVYVSAEDLTDLAMCTYYACKSAVYQDRQYFSELMRIQDKIYFCRSVAVMSLVAVLLTLLSAGLYPAFWSVQSTRSALRSAKSAYLLIALFLILNLLIYVASKYSYADYEAGFASRCYAYYISKLESDRNQQGSLPTSQ